MGFPSGFHALVLYRKTLIADFWKHFKVKHVFCKIVGFRLESTGSYPQQNQLRNGIE